MLTFVATVYRNYPAVEWVVWLENTGAADIPMLSEVCAGDLVVTARQCSRRSFRAGRSIVPNCSVPQD